MNHNWKESEFHSQKYLTGVGLTCVQEFTCSRCGKTVEVSSGEIPNIKGECVRLKQTPLLQKRLAIMETEAPVREVKYKTKRRYR